MLLLPHGWAGVQVNLRLILILQTSLIYLYLCTLDGTSAPHSAPCIRRHIWNVSWGREKKHLEDTFGHLRTHVLMFEPQSLELHQSFIYKRNKHNRK